MEEILNEIEFSSPSETTSPPCLPASEVDDFVDSFINMDHCRDDDIQSLEKQQSFDYYDQDGMETFSMVDDMYGDVLMMMEGDDMEMGGLAEDFGVGETNMVPSVEEVTHGVDQGFTWCTCCWLVLRLWAAGTPNLQNLCSAKFGLQLVLGVILCRESHPALQWD
ncbi:hypothetical protein Prudu_011715 [Prunus dulcis]|uniref:Uncharacterized protein n=1 Tax=Prunus dulcis TaxID=3755 RepID=A0A4Y1RB73_PRUDU|nr:hypothetical protein Prudu_011715 [Prunus dulcis]